MVASSVAIVCSSKFDSYILLIFSRIHVPFLQLLIKEKWLSHNIERLFTLGIGERGGSVVERPTPEQEVGCSKPTSAVLCP